MQVVGRFGDDGRTKQAHIAEKPGATLEFHLTDMSVMISKRTKKKLWKLNNQLHNTAGTARSLVVQNLSEVGKVG